MVVDDSIASMLIPVLILGGLGLLFLVLGIAFLASGKRNMRRCTQRVTGVVTDAKYVDNDGMCVPVISYVVEGREYQFPKRFAGYVTSNRPALDPNARSSAWVSSRNVLHVQHVTNFGRGLDGLVDATNRDLVLGLFPIGTPMPVLYDPEDPAKAYVEGDKGSNGLRIVGIAFTIAGGVQLGIAAVIALAGLLPMLIAR